MTEEQLLLLLLLLYARYWYYNRYDEMSCVCVYSGARFDKTSLCVCVCLGKHMDVFNFCYLLALQLPDNKHRTRLLLLLLQLTNKLNKTRWALLSFTDQWTRKLPIYSAPDTARLLNFSQHFSMLPRTSQSFSELLNASQCFSKLPKARLNSCRDQQQSLCVSVQTKGSFA